MLHRSSQVEASSEMRPPSRSVISSRMEPWMRIQSWVIAVQMVSASFLPSGRTLAALRRAGLVDEVRDGAVLHIQDVPLNHLVERLRESE